MQLPRSVRAAIAGLLAASMTASSVVAQGVPEGMALDSDEAGLRIMFEKAEKDIQRSPLLIKDPALNAYVRSIVCKIAGPRCNELRIYILDIPMFNASMAPNGMMHVWSGLLLRVKNEAELAFVLGHEYRHYDAKHSLAQYQSVRDTANVLSFFGLIAAGVGVGFVGSLAQLAALGALFSYGRDQEREADQGGLDALTANGYDPRAGGAIWAALQEEHAANPDRESRSLFSTTHPKVEERVATLTEAAGKMLAAGTPPGITGEGALRAALRPHRTAWLDGEFTRGEYDESLVLINRLLTVEPSSGELLFFQGEAYRRRDKDGDLQAARDSYQRAIGQATPFAAAFRGLGLVAMKQGDKAAARQAFTQYLARVPQADDRAMIDFYLKSL